MIWLLLLIANGPLTLFVAARRAIRRRSANPEQQRKRVVVVGASVSGLWCQRDLEDDFDVTVIDYKEYFEYTPGILRVFVDAAHLAKITCAIPALRSTFVNGEVVDFDEGCVHVKPATGGPMTKVEYDYLLVGCGSTYAAPIKATMAERTLEQRKQTWATEHAKLAKASSVLVIGAGPVGIELAAEVLTAYPEKKVTIVDGASSLLSAFPAATAEHTEAWLSRRNCELVLNEFVASLDETGCKLQSGRDIRADIVYKCMGFRPASGPLARYFGNSIDKRGSIIVNDFLQVEQHPNVFAMGDVMIHAPSNELKLGHTAEVNAHLVCANLRRHEAAKPMLRYPEGVTAAQKTPKVYAVSLGKYDGTLGFNWLVLNGVLAAVAKWLLEWTKLAATEQRAVGVLFWEFSDWAACLLGRTVLSDGSPTKAA